MRRHKVRLDGPGLGALLEEAGLTLVDIGGRGKPRPELVALAPFSRLVVCDPDAQEAARLGAELAQSHWRAVSVIPAAIAAHEGEATLYETAKPGMSSLLEPDPAVYSRLRRAKTFEVVGTSTVPTIPLDLAARRHGFEDACFLKLDTQGTELEVLRSGEALLDRSVVGVYTEALFQAFYKGQALFADTDSYLRERGFTLVELRRSALRGHVSLARPELYSERQVTWAHCLYLRTSPDSARSLVRAVLLALAYEQHDLALELARRGDDDLAERVERHIEQASARVLAGLSATERLHLLRSAERD